MRMPYLYSVREKPEEDCHPDLNMLYSYVTTGHLYKGKYITCTQIGETISQKKKKQISKKQKYF